MSNPSSRLTLSDVTEDVRALANALTDYSLRVLGNSHDPIELRAYTKAREALKRLGALAAVGVTVAEVRDTSAGTAARPPRASHAEGGGPRTPSDARPTKRGNAPKEDAPAAAAGEGVHQERASDKAATYRLERTQQLRCNGCRRTSPVIGGFPVPGTRHQLRRQGAATKACGTWIPVEPCRSCHLLPGTMTDNLCAPCAANLYGRSGEESAA